MSSTAGTPSPVRLNFLSIYVAFFTRFILPDSMCAELSFEVLGRKMGDQDVFLGRVSVEVPENALFEGRQRNNLDRLCLPLLVEPAQ